MIAIAVAIIVGTVLQLAGPFLIQIAIDDYLVPQKMTEIMPLLLVLIATYVGNIILTWFESYYSSVISARVGYRLDKELFAKYQKLPIKFFDRQPIGELMSRVTSDVDAVTTSISNSLTSIISGVFTLVGTMIVMWQINWILALVTFVTIPLSLVISLWVGKKSHKYFTKQQEHIAQINGFAEESITGIKTVKIFGQENEMKSGFEKLNTAYMKSSGTAQILGLMLPVSMTMINNVNYVVVSLLGGWLGVRGLISVGAIASFFQYSRQFSRPVNDLASQYNSLQLALASAERIFEILDEPEEVEWTGVEHFDLQGEITADQITFGYLPGKTVLRDISFQAEPGKTIALVGPTGSGKTTVVNLLMRFYDLDKKGGRIEYDGRDIHEYQLSNLRSQIGMVLQDTHLFSGTIADNLRYGKLDATREEIEEAARQATVDKFIKHLPHGYKTVLASGGSNLSHGQRQLLAIARAILSDPAILILDEATSSVDTRTEIEIQKAILKVRAGRTAIIIAHRLSTIQDADEILVIKSGQIIERGNHQQLIDHQGFYYQLWSGQYQDDDIKI